MHLLVAPLELHDVHYDFPELTLETLLTPFFFLPWSIFQVMQPDLVPELRFLHSCTQFWVLPNMEIGPTQLGFLNLPPVFPFNSCGCLQLGDLLTIHGCMQRVTLWYVHFKASVHCSLFTLHFLRCWSPFCTSSLLVTVYMSSGQQT
jgi:hypothetical protein